MLERASLAQSIDDVLGYLGRDVVEASTAALYIGSSTRQTWYLRGARLTWTVQA